jgi:hypothetical protein
MTVIRQISSINKLCDKSRGWQMQGIGGKDEHGPEQVSIFIYAHNPGVCVYFYTGIKVTSNEHQNLIQKSQHFDVKSSMTQCTHHLQWFSVFNM